MGGTGCLPTCVAKPQVVSFRRAANIHNVRTKPPVIARSSLQANWTTHTEFHVSQLRRHGLRNDRSNQSALQTLAIGTPRLDADKRSYPFKNAGTARLFGARNFSPVRSIFGRQCAACKGDATVVAPLHEHIVERLNVVDCFTLESTRTPPNHSGRPGQLGQLCLSDPDRHLTSLPVRRIGFRPAIPSDVSFPFCN
jgi:hypothetical protein